MASMKNKVTSQKSRSTPKTLLTKNLSPFTVGLVRNVDPKDFGGAEKFQLELAKQLQQNHLSPIIITSSIKLQQEAKTANIKVLRAPYCRKQNWSGFSNLLLPLYFLWQIYLTFWYIVKLHTQKIDCLHLQSRDDMLAGTLAAKLSHRRIIWTDHADFRAFIFQNINQKHKNTIGKILYKLSYSTSAITTVSQHEYCVVTKMLKPKHLPNFQVILNGVVDTFNDDAKITNTKNRNLTFLGRLCIEKGIDELLEAFITLPDQYHDVKLHLYGDGEIKTTLQKTYPQKNIIWHGYTNNPRQAILDSPIFILPSYKEGLSLALLEACMLERAIITTDIDGNLEVIENYQNGLLVPSKNVDKLRIAIQTLLDDEALRKRLAHSARKTYLERFNFSKIVKEQLIPIIEEGNHV